MIVLTALLAFIANSGIVVTICVSLALLYVSAVICKEGELLVSAFSVNPEATAKIVPGDTPVKVEELGGTGVVLPNKDSDLVVDLGSIVPLRGMSMVLTGIEHWTVTFAKGEKPTVSKRK